jgi:hypothetical protein
VGESIVHGQAYDTKHTALPSVNVFPYKLKPWRDVSLEAGDIRKSLEGSFFAFPAQEVGGGENPKPEVDEACMKSEVSPETSWGCYCSRLISNMRQRSPRPPGFGGRSIEDVSMAKRGHLKNWSLQILGL